MVRLLDQEQWPQYGVIDPELAEILPSLPPMWRVQDFPSVEEGRKLVNTGILEGVAKAKHDFSGVDKSEISIPVRDDTSIRALKYQPSDLREKRGPLVVLFHSGGWLFGVPEGEEDLALPFVRNHGAVVLSVEYRKGGDVPFPVPLHDCFDAVQWAGTNSQSLGADPENGFIVGGSSSGANHAIIVSLLARDEKLSPPLTGVLARIPPTCTFEALPSEFKSAQHSFIQNKDAPLIGSEDLLWTYKTYGADLLSPVFNPLIWPTGHEGLPPTYIQVNGMDPLRDDGLEYDVVLRRAGVSTKIDVYPGVPHDWEMAFPTLSISKTVPKNLHLAMSWLLHNG